MTYKTITDCRACGSGELIPLFSIGEQYVNDFVDQENVLAGHVCPIELVLCPRCSLVQAKHTAPQDFMYTRHYWYRSGVTRTMRDALRDVAEQAGRLIGLREGDVVLDIGSNDGTLLRCYPDDAFKVGVEPASNMVEEGSQGVDCFIGDFWSHDVLVEHLGREFPGAKVITALGMFYDLEDPNRFIGDVAKALHPEGIFVAQLMCLRNMVDSMDVGNLSHEHLEFYSLRSLRFLYDRHGLEIVDVERNEVNGGSYRIFARLKGSSVEPFPGAERRVELAEVQDEGLDDPVFFRRWFSMVEENKRRVVEFIKDAVADGIRVWVYGASTKGNVLLQYYGLDRTIIGGASERSPEKWGKFTIGTGIPIFSEDHARKVAPDYFLVLPYAFVDEFVERESAWRDKGGRFIVPLPHLKIV